MEDLRITTKKGTDTVLDETSLQGFKSSVRGQMFRNGDSGYEVARKIFNGMIDRHPALIVRCEGVADVMATVNFARDHDLLVAVRGGGHSAPGFSMCEGGLVVDLSAMRSVRVDPIRRTARAEGGATWGDFDHATQAFGLACTGGIASSTGIAGLTLGGGLGYLNRKYGLACDNLISADVVTADGQLLTTSATENGDLFWALRGGGGNFGVVTSFEYQLHQVGPVLAGLLVWPIERANEVLRFYRAFVETAPDELRLDVILGTSPLGPSVVIITCWCGPIEEGERVISPLRAFGSPALDTIATIPYKTIQGLLESMGFRPGQLHYWKSGFLKELSETTIDAIVAAYQPTPTPLCVTTIEHLGGAISRVPSTDTAFTHRHLRHCFLTLGVADDPADAGAITAWARKQFDAARPYLEEGVYVNYLEEDEGTARLQSAYGVNYARLTAIKAKYDPGNLFRLNQNIKPTSTGKIEKML
jgi:FAD/FMN-containing dehydrogenase